MRVFEIEGSKVKVDKAWTISDKLNARTTLSCKVLDKLSLSGIQNGDEITLMQNDVKVFGGIINSLKRREPDPGRLEYAIGAVDYSILCDKRRIVRVFENVSAGFIVHELIRLKLGEEGIQAGTIEEGPIIKRAVFNYWTCSKALDHLKTLTGFNWYVDVDKRLHFIARETYTSPFVLDQAHQHKHFEHQSVKKDYRNVQYTRGGKYKTSLQEEEKPTPAPDGASRNFLLRYPLAERPIIEVNQGGSGWVLVPESDIGVNGLDKNKKWYFEYNSAVIVHDEEVPLNKANGDQIRVSYKGLRNLFLRLENTDEIEDRRQKEKGTSGIYEHLAVEKSLDDAGSAMQYSEGLLKSYGKIKDMAAFTTVLHGLKAGQLLHILKPLFDLDDDFLIESITIRPFGPNLVQYVVKALDGSPIGGWERLFVRLTRNQEDFVIAENEVIITIQHQDEPLSYSGSYDVTVLEGLVPSESLVPHDGLTPGIAARRELINDEGNQSMARTI